MTETENKSNSPVLNAIEVLCRRIETTAKTDPEIFEEVCKYIDAAEVLLYQRRGRMSKFEILRTQLFANELAKAIPTMLQNVQDEFVKVMNDPKTKEYLTVTEKE